MGDEFLCEVQQDLGTIKVLTFDQKGDFGDLNFQVPLLPLAADVKLIEKGCNLFIY